VGIGRGKDKEALAKKLGATGFVDAAAGDPAAALQKMGGAKAILSMVTDGAAMASMVGRLAINGTLLVVGAPWDQCRSIRFFFCWASGL
jgi:alcohol dehydrogenase